MFWFVTNFTSDLSEWDVSSVTDMSFMFEFVSKFTSDLSEWDVSRVTNMRSMFTGATVFTSDLSEWDVSRVTNMRFMLSGANSFNSDISNWNVSSATDMTSMVSNNHAFVQNLGKWYVVLDDTTIDAMDVPRIVGRITPQTTALTGSRPIYAIGTGGDSDSFRIIARNILWMYVTPDKALYNVNITYGGGSLGTNNHRVYDITVTSIDTNSAIAPTLASIERHSPADQNTDSQTLVYKVTFSEDVTGVNTGDFVLSQGSAGAGSTASMTGSGSVYYATVSATQDGTYNLDLVSPGHGIADAANNPLSSPVPTGADHTYTVTLQVTIADSLNSPPEVEAGDDQEVVEGATVTLSGTASDVDPGDTLTYSWTHDGTLAITITGSDSLSASFTAHDVAVNTTITVTLTVNDGTVEVSDALQVTIADSPSQPVANSPPEVEAGADQEVAEGSTVTLSGTASDVDPGDTLTYSWTHDSALAITITGSDSLSASFTAPDVAANTTITVTLTVNDGTVDASDALQVTIADSPSIPPAADAGLNLTAAGSITDTGTLELLGARAIATFESGGSTYAAVIAYFDNGVQVLDVTDPSAITAAGSITDDAALKLAGASGIAVFESGGSTYAAVIAYFDNGVQVLDVTDPSDITAAGSITDTATLELDGALGIATFESGGSTYAAVASYFDYGVQILNITDPSAITAAGNIGDDRALELAGAEGIATFTSGGSTYAAVASSDDNGVQILRLTGGIPPR